MKAIREKAANLALAATIGLTVFKLGVGWMSGSVGVISEGIHSLLDLVSAAVAFFTIRAAVKPADHEHPFGHGKFETLSSLLESVLLIAAAAWIFYEGAVHWANPQAIQHEALAMVTIFISVIVSYVVYRQNIKAALLSESRAIHVNALHFLADVIASIGVFVGLVLMKLTGWYRIDSIVAFGIALYILWISVRQVQGSLRELADRQLPDVEVKRVKEILLEFQREHDLVVESHDLRTRKSGSSRQMDFHLILCGEMSVNHSHALCDKVEARLHDVFPTSSVTIHVEPCEHGHSGCLKQCPLKKKV